MATPSEIKKNHSNQSRRGGARPGAGRKRGRPDRATAGLKEGLEAKARVHTADAIAALVEIARNGESEPARVSAACALLDRGYGKPRQAVEHTGKDGGPIAHQVWRFGDREIAF